jgi:hypothetical protein
MSKFIFMSSARNPDYIDVRFVRSVRPNAPRPDEVPDIQVVVDGVEVLLTYRMDDRGIRDADLKRLVALWELWLESGDVGMMLASYIDGSKKLPPPIARSILVLADRLELDGHREQTREGVSP